MSTPRRGTTAAERARVAARRRPPHPQCSTRGSAGASSHARGSSCPQCGRGHRHTATPCHSSHCVLPRRPQCGQQLHLSSTARGTPVKNHKYKTIRGVEHCSRYSYQQHAQRDWTKEKNRDTNTRTPNRRALTYPSPKTVGEWGPPHFAGGGRPRCVLRYAFKLLRAI